MRVGIKRRNHNLAIEMKRKRLKQGFRGTETVRESGRIINVEIESYGIASVMALMNTLVMRAQPQGKVLWRPSSKMKVRVRDTMIKIAVWFQLEGMILGSQSKSLLLTYKVGFHCYHHRQESQNSNQNNLIYRDLWWW